MRNDFEPGATSRTGNSPADEPDGDGEVLTPEMLNFAEVVGRLLAECWERDLLNSRFAASAHSFEFGRR